MTNVDADKLESTSCPRSVLQSIKGKGDRLQASIRRQEFELLSWLLQWCGSFPSYNGEFVSQVISAELYAHM